MANASKKEKNPKEVIGTNPGDAAIRLLSQIKHDLEVLGFNTDDEVSGSDLVDVMSIHYSSIKRLLKKVKL